MAVTLATAQTLTQSKLLKGVIEEVRKNSPFLDTLSFRNTTESAVQITREKVGSLGSAGFINPGEDIESSEADFESATFTVYQAITQADVDNFYRANMNSFNDQLKVQVAIKSKLMARLVEDQLFYGSATTTKGFDGLQTLADAATTANPTWPRQFSMGGSSATPAPLSALELDTVIDSFTAGMPTAMFMSKRTHRYLSAYMRTVSQVEDMGRDNWGNYIKGYRGIKIYPCDLIRDTELADSDGTWVSKTGGASSSIYFVRFGEGDGLVGLQNGGIDYQYFERLEKKNCTRVRLLWYVGLMLHSRDAIAVLNNISGAPMVSGLS